MNATGRIAFPSALAAMLCALQAPVQAAVPSWGPVQRTSPTVRFIDDPTRVAVSFEAATRPEPEDGDASWDVTLKVPARGGVVRARELLVVSDDAFDEGGSVPVARVSVTARFEWLRRSAYERIYRGRTFSRFWNVCVRGRKDILSAGGDLYCVVYHPGQVRMVTRTTIRNFPRPRVISKRDLGPIDGACTVGAVRRDEKQTGDKVFECRDQQVAESSSGEPFPRALEVTADIWTGKAWVRRTSRTTTTGRGPAWVETGFAPLPAPSATVAGWTKVRDYFDQDEYDVWGTYSCAYRDRSFCPPGFSIQASDGSWALAGNPTYTPEWMSRVRVPDGTTPTTTVRF